MDIGWPQTIKFLFNKIDNDELKEFLTTFCVFDGVKSVEQLANTQEKHFIIPADATVLVNHHVSENGFGYMEIEYAIGLHEFAQILDTVKNRLLDFVLELSENWDAKETPPSKDVLNNLVSVYIYNTSQGAQMSTTFDQRGQQVNNQYNAAGNINLNINDKDSLIDELEKLRLEIERVKNSQELHQDVAIEAEYHILQASKEAQRPKPRKSIFVEHIENAKTLLSNIAAVAGLVSALTKIIESAQQLLK